MVLTYKPAAHRLASVPWRLYKMDLFPTAGVLYTIDLFKCNKFSTCSVHIVKSRGRLHIFLRREAN